MKKIFVTIFSFLNMCKGTTSTKSSTHDKRSFVRKLIDDDTNVSAGNFFLVVMTIVGVIMLIVPIGGLVVDLCFNHTITINLSDMASYILAVTGIFGVAGLSNAWVEYSWNKYGKNIFDENCQPEQQNNIMTNTEE